MAVKDGVRGRQLCCPFLLVFYVLQTDSTNDRLELHIVIVNRHNGAVSRGWLIELRGKFKLRAAVHNGRVGCLIVCTNFHSGLDCAVVIVTIFRYPKKKSKTFIRW